MISLYAYVNIPTPGCTGTGGHATIEEITDAISNIYKT